MFSSYLILGGDAKEPGEPPDQRMEAVEVGDLQAGSGKTTVGSSPTHLASLADTVVERNGDALAEPDAPRFRCSIYAYPGRMRRLQASW